MAVTAKVAASPSASVTSAPGRVAMGGRFTSAERIDSVSGAAPPVVSGGWRSSYDDNAGQGGFGQYPSQQTPEMGHFDPLINRSAGAFPASEAGAEPRLTKPLFLTDLLHGVGVYEFNMKVIAGTLKQQGQVLNRYS